MSVVAELTSPQHTLVLEILAKVDLLLHSYVYQGYEAVSQYLRTPLGVLISLYIAILGYSIVMGLVKADVQTFTKHILKIGFIYTAAMEWSWVSENVIGVFHHVVDEIGDCLVMTSPMHLPVEGGISFATQEVLAEFYHMGSVIFKAGGIGNIGAYFDGIMVWGFGFVMVGLGLLEIILSKVMLSILFIFIPMIVSFCLYKPFQPIFDRWLGALIGFALLQLFVTAALALALTISHWWLATYEFSAATEIGNVGSLPIIILGIICIGIILKASDLAQNLGGMVSSASGAALMGSSIGSFLGASKLLGGKSGGIPRSVMSLGKDAVGSGVGKIRDSLHDSLAALRKRW